MTSYVRLNQSETPLVLLRENDPDYRDVRLIILMAAQVLLKANQPSIPLEAFTAGALTFYLRNPSIQIWTSLVSAYRITPEAFDSLMSFMETSPLLIVSNNTSLTYPAHIVEIDTAQASSLIPESHLSRLRTLGNKVHVLFISAAAVSVVNEFQEQLHPSLRTRNIQVIAALFIIFAFTAGMIVLVKRAG